MSCPGSLQIVMRSEEQFRRTVTAISVPFLEKKNKRTEWAGVAITL
jgi:hypothetical protein